MDAAVKEETAEMSEANRQRNSIESAVDVPSPGIYAAQSFSIDKQQTLAEEQSTQVTASERFHMVEAMMSMYENYLRDNADFKGFIQWALVDNNGHFEKPGGIEESGSMERNDKSYNSLNYEQPGGIEETEDMERNDESYNSMIFEQPGRIEESDGMERNDKFDNYLNAFHKAGQATSFYKVKGIEEAISAQNRKAARPVHAKRTYHELHYEGHTSLRSYGRWANNWQRTRRNAVLHKSQLKQKYPTTGWKYATKGYWRHERSGDTSWTFPSTVAIKSRPVRRFQ